MSWISEWLHLFKRTVKLFLGICVYFLILSWSNLGLEEKNMHLSSVAPVFQADVYLECKQYC